jgi:hypothetical protein
MNKDKISILTSPLNLLHNLEATVVDLIESFTWGKVGKQSIVTLEDIKYWINDQPAGIKKKAYYGAVARMEEAGSEQVRLFQALFDKKETCIISRQIIAGAIADNLEKEFGTTDLIIYSMKTEFVSKYQR